MSITVTIEGDKELLQAFERLANINKSALPRASKKAADLILRRAKIMVPVKTGALRRGLIIKKEKSNSPTKCVYIVTFEKSPYFFKKTKSGKQSFYPASQEFGFRARNGRRVPGKLFLTRAADFSAKQAESIIEHEAGKAIDNAWG
jgi:hypothetical protein